MSEATHTLFHQIVVEGLFRPAGMRSFPNLPSGDFDALRGYLVNQALGAYLDQR